MGIIIWESYLEIFRKVENMRIIDLEILFLDRYLRFFFICVRGYA